MGWFGWRLDAKSLGGVRTLWAVHPLAKRLSAGGSTAFHDFPLIDESHSRAASLIHLYSARGKYGAYMQSCMTACLADLSPLSDSELMNISLSWGKLCVLATTNISPPSHNGDQQMLV